MRGFNYSVLKNAAANVVRGIATGIVALALPHFLTRVLSPERFGAWSLMMQIAAIASYLDFGLQTAVARYVAHHLESGEIVRLNVLFNTAFAMLAGAGLVALSATGVILLQLPAIIHGVSSALLQEFRIATALLAFTTCVLLPFSAYTGLLIGLHRNEYPAFAIGGSRILGAAAAIWAGYQTHSLIALAACVGLANLAGGVMQMANAHRLIGSLRLRIVTANRTVAAELARYCFALTVWSFGVFLVSGMDLAVVGHFEFKAVGYYAVATVLITCYIGFGSAAINALLTPMAALYARRDLERIRLSLLLATRITVAVSAALVTLVFCYGEPLLRLWVDGSYAQPAFTILRILLVAQAIRFIGAAFCVMLVATGQQRYGIAGALIEGIVSLIASLCGAAWLGPIGVALGTLVGTAAGVLWLVTKTMPRTQIVPLPPRDFLSDGVLRPLLCCLPLVCSALLSLRTLDKIQIWIPLLALALSTYLALRFGDFFQTAENTNSSAKLIAD